MKKFNFLKIICFILVIVISSVSAFFSADLIDNHTGTSTRVIVRNILNYRNYENIVADKFTNANTNLIYTLDTLAEKYGDGSKAAYEKRKNDYPIKVKRAKEDLLYHIKETVLTANDYGDGTLNYIFGCVSNSYITLEPLNIDGYNLNNIAGYVQYLSFEEIAYDEGFHIDPDIYNDDYWENTHIYNDEIKYVEKSYPNSVAKKVKEGGYDGAICLNVEIINNYDFYDEMSTTTLTTDSEAYTVNSVYKGFFGIKVNTDKINYEMGESFFESYDEFYSSYKDLLKIIETEYAGAEYAIFDGDKIVATNIKGIDKTSSVKEIKKSLSDYQLAIKYSPETDETEFIKNKPGFSFGLLNVYFKSTRFTYYIGYETGEKGTAFIDEISYDYKSRFNYVKEDFFLVALILGTSFISLAIIAVILICKSGRKKGSDKLYMHSLDNMWIELRFLLDAGIIAATILLSISILNLVPQNHLYFTTYMILFAVIFNVISLAILDFLLYCARNIKNHTFLTRISIVWIINNVIKKFSAFILKKCSGLRKKYLYVGDVEKNVKIKTLIIVAINVAWGLLSVGFDDISSKVTCFLPLFVFDCYILLRGIRFVGSVKRIFRAVGEIRNGNEHVKIDKTAIPETFHETADNLLSINDGIKIAVERAMQNEKMKTELITNVSHDLKTPLTSIINYVDLLQKCPIEDETTQSYLAILSEKSDRLKKLIEDLVEASKASSGAIAVHPIEISVGEMINQLVGEHEDALAERNLTVIVNVPEEDFTVKADSNLLYRVLENLIVNVKKYAMENTRVYIKAEKYETIGNIIIKNISAAPLNMTPEELKNRFVRGDVSRSTSGNGLGLSIAENLCELMDGRLDLCIDGDLFTAVVEMPLS